MHLDVSYCFIQKISKIAEIFWQSPRSQRYPCPEKVNSDTSLQTKELSALANLQSWLPFYRFFSLYFSISLFYLASLTFFQKAMTGC
jgi:hypothetical protein